MTDFTRSEPEPVDPRQLAIAAGLLIATQYGALMRIGVPLEELLRNVAEHVSDWFALYPDRQNELREEHLRAFLRAVRRRTNEKLVERRSAVAKPTADRPAGENKEN